MAITKKGKGWKLKFEKPKKMKETDLFDLETTNNKGNLIVVKDCTYNSITNNFTQVDTKETFYRLDPNVLHWKKQ